MSDPGAASREQLDWEHAVQRAADADQRLRESLHESADLATDAAAVQAMDWRNVQIVSEVLTTLGWPSAPPWQPPSVTAFWLLVQHCPDNALQAAALDSMRRACAAGRADPVQLAHLQDRVLVRRGRPQLYGTQLAVTGGAVRLLPLDDRARADERRRQVGLPALDDYVRDMTSHLLRIAAGTGTSGDREPGRWRSGRGKSGKDND